MTNKELTDLLDCTGDWIVSRSGIPERRLVKEGEATSNLAYYAAVQALQDAQLLPEELDMILVDTETPDHMFPVVSCQVQHMLGCKTIPSFDLYNTCVGFLSALQVAEQCIKLG